MTGWILANAALKGIVVLGAAFLIVLAMRRRSAAARHLVWTAAAAAVLALPFLSVGMPALQLPIFAADLPPGSGVVFRVFSIPTAVASSIGFASAPSGSAGQPAVAAWPIGDLLVALWAIGGGIVLLQMLAAYVAMWHKRSAARPFDDRGLGAALAGSLGLRHPVTILQAPAGSMPIAFGLLRPVIFLPAEAAEWSEERLRMVLLHELAHVRRGDLALHLLARTALSLHWWNPLAWIAWRESLKERERAADDLVLNAGARASDYAGHLLEVARSLQSGPATAWAAVAMARPSQLEGRLVAILDGRIRRGAAGRLAPLAAVLAAVAIVAPFAAVRAQTRPAPPELESTIRAAISQRNYEMLDNAARVYIDLYKYEPAQTLLENALTIRGQVSGEQSAAYAAGLVKLGDLAEKRRQYAEADRFYARAVTLGDRAEIAPALLYLGMKAHGAQNYEAALEFFQRALNVDPQGVPAGRALTWMAVMRQNQPDAEILFERALAILPPDSPATATALELYAKFLEFHQRHAEAEQHLARSRDIWRARVNNPAATPSGKAVQITRDLTAPKLILKLEPEYTAEARAAKLQGAVLLSVEINPEGQAQSIRVAKTLGMGLDEKAIEAVKQWRFRPASDQAGNLITAAATIEVNFRLM